MRLHGPLGWLARRVFGASGWAHWPLRPFAAAAEWAYHTDPRVGAAGAAVRELQRGLFASAGHAVWWGAKHAAAARRDDGKGRTRLRRRDAALAVCGCAATLACDAAVRRVARRRARRAAVLGAAVGRRVGGPTAEWWCARVLWAVQQVLFAPQAMIIGRGAAPRSAHAGGGR
eukprot:gene11997-8406_t